jgi:tRNA threonylcarbamoyladenosine biosynthesis protein TsaB
MRVLALDTSTRAGSVALVEDDRVIDERGGDGSRTHAERLPRELSAIVEAHGLTWSDIDRYAVASGPGSFTGLRIGIATMQGFAFVQQRSIVGVPVLEALGHLGSRDVAAGAIVAAWADAYRRDVFSAAYRVTMAPPFDPDRLDEVDGAAVDLPVATLNRWKRDGVAPALFIGDGAALYAADIAAAQPAAAVVKAPCLAGAIGRLAAARARRGEAVEPSRLHPFYVRRPDVEVARDATTPSSR